MNALKATLLSRRGLLAWVVLLAGLLSTALIWTGLQEERNRSAQAQFDLYTRKVVASIEKRMLDHEQILLGGAGLFDASDDVTRSQWRVYVERLRLAKNYPGIQGVGFSKAIHPEGLAPHIEGVRAAGFPQYTVRPPGERALYTSIIYLEPFVDRNLAAFGYDMFSEATRRKAMQQAVESNAATITGKVKLVQETHGKEQAGFLMYVPVYRKNLPLASAEQRWQALLGYVYSPYRVEDLMRGILGENDLLVDFSLHDGNRATAEALMLDSADARADQTAHSPQYSTTQQIDAYGNVWTVTLRSRSAFENQFASPLDGLLPILGAGISLSLFALILSLLSRREQALALADEMTRKRAASEERFHQFFLHLGQGVLIHRSDGTIIDANPAAERILGMRLDQMQGHAPGDLDCQTIREDGSPLSADAHPAMAALRDGQPVTGVVMGVRHSEAGPWRWVSVDAYPRNEGLGTQEQRGYSVLSDITERKAADLELLESEQRFRHMLETCPTAARIARSGGVDVIFSNRRYAELINAASGQASGVDPTSYYAHPEDYADVLRQLEDGKPVFDRLIELTIPGAGTKWALASYLPIQYEGAPAVLGWFYDITERKRAESALLEQAEHTQAILDHMVDGIITIDQTGHIASFNPAAERIFGYASDEVLGQNVKILMPNPHRDAHDSYLRNYQATGVARIIGIGRETEGLRRDGSLFPMELAVSEITREGKPMYVGMVRDITERKRIDRMKSEFVSTVSHELRTPLTSISGALGLVAGGALGELPSQAREMVGIAHKNSQRLTHLINDLLDMEKITAGKLHFDLQVQPLAPLIEQALEANRVYGTERRVSLLLAGEVPDVTVRVDSQRLMQVMSNLLSNAFKFSPEGGEVSVSVALLGASVQVTVSDQGSGIPTAFRDRIFQKFAQADSSDTRQKGGTGLGLAITRKLVERMDGQIGFESEEGHGARFHFELPVWHAQTRDDNTVLSSDDRQLLGIVNHRVATADRPHQRLLHVEDDRDLHQVIRTLVGTRFDVELATSLHQARERLAAQRFDAVILDLSLPDGSGWDLLSEIRSLQPAARVIILTGSDTTADEARRVEAVLLKSQVDPLKLLDALSARIYPSPNPGKTL